MKLRAPLEVELQDVQSVMVDQKRRASRVQAKEGTSAWFVDILLPTKTAYPSFLMSFPLFVN